jgi:predicted nucleotidyltransferase
MIQPKYIDRIKQEISTFDPEGENRYFLFGSSVRKDRFHDIDLGIVGNGKSQKSIGDLRDQFYESRIPYKVDVVDFDEANEGFKKYVYSHEPIVWLN